MAEPLVANLLGPPRFTQDQVPVTCASRKSLGLFAYLLLGARTHARRELAALLWGRGDEEAARASLRVALHRLPPAMAQCLRVDRESIELATLPVLDVARFERLAGSGDLASLEVATELYQGELLQDFDADAPEFDDWLHAQRTRLAQLAQQAFDGVMSQRAELARQDAAQAATERESALATGRRWAALMPGAEAAHRWLMQLYVDMGRRDAALAQYDLCQRFLAVTYGRAPSAQTRALYEAALGRAAADSPAATVEGRAQEPVARSLVPATSFVGRIEELAELDRILADPNCRLLTLHGLGGAGKTRLAHALATQVASRFAQGVTWVGLEALDSADGLPAAIAAALGRELAPRGDRAELVATLLAGQERLLVLDNLETLLGRGDIAADAQPAAVVARILDKAPQVRVLATSRDVLALQEEWVYDVHGLALEAQPHAQGAVPAVELFAQRARQAYLGFSLPAEMPHVLRICALVEGLPLGIELAAAWVRTIPCGEIAAQIERTAASLETRHRNRNERHRSLDAVVAYSWDLLTREQQHTLAALSVFVGGFTRDAGERVADATLRSLSVLVDKSLVRRRREGRYDLHEIVRQFALARLAKNRTRHGIALRRHAELFADLAVKLAADAQGPAEREANGVLAAESANMLAAYEHASAQAWREIVARIATPLASLVYSSGRVPLALDVAQRAATLLEGHAHDATLALLRSQLGRAAMTHGNMDVGMRELQAAVAAARRSGQPTILARALFYLASLLYQQGDLARHEATLLELLPLAEKVGDPFLVAIAHNSAGAAANMRSRFDLSEEHLRKALAAARATGAPSLIAGTLCGVAPPLYYRGNFDEAAAVTEEAARIYATLGRNATVPLLRSNLAAILIAKGDLEHALVHARSAVDLAREMGELNALGASSCTLADVWLRMGSLDEARAAAEEGMRFAQATGSMLHAQESLFLLASIDIAAGHRSDARSRLGQLRDSLAKHRLDVRVPMLILATADWVAAFDPAQWPRARAWLHGLAHDREVDATLRDRARAILARVGEDAAEATVPLAAIEADVLAYLDER